MRDHTRPAILRGETEQRVHGFVSGVLLGLTVAPLVVVAAWLLRVIP